jgi:cellulose biosynthesis protein BcsQ
MILGIYNPNGGCGKTTTAVNVATELARRGRSVLLVDLQPDMGASISVGVRHGDNHPSVFELLINERRPSDALRKIRAFRTCNSYLVLRPSRALTRRCATRGSPSAAWRTASARLRRPSMTW